MKFQLIYIAILAVFFYTTGCAQTKPVAGKVVIATPASNASFKFLGTIPGNYIYFNIDNLDNIYLMTAGNQLKKLDSKGDSIAVFNDVKKYGNPSYIDVNNPLKLLVYYKNFSSVVVLDRLLTQRNSINLRKQNIFSVQAVATSYDNNIWLFDEQDYKLKKISEEGTIMLESTDMRQLVDAVPSPQRVIDADNLVYLYDEQKGFYVFDYYGALKNQLPFTGWSDVAISGNMMMGFSQDKLYRYELKSLQLKTYELPAFFKPYNAIRAVNGKVYLLKDNGLDIYSVQ